MTSTTFYIILAIAFVLSLLCVWLMERSDR